MMSTRTLLGAFQGTVGWPSTLLRRNLLHLRTLMTPVQQPPVNSTVPESTVSIILTEDAGFYESSWHDGFKAALPEKGVPYSKFSLSDDKPGDFDSALREMKDDLSTDATNTVLVTRGPWMSWMASFYLESLPLAGLVMIDPMQLDDMNGINQFCLQYEKLGLLESHQYKLYQEFAEHWDHWTLKLEPGAVPMLVLYTNIRPGYKRCADNSALRHGDVAVIKAPSTSRSHVDDSMDHILSWIDEKVV